MRVYVAGPYSLGNRVRNARNAVLVAEEVCRMGHVPYVPHLTLLWDLVADEEHTWDWWLTYDEQWLALCGAVLRIPGESAGADREVAFAAKHGIPVFHSLDELREVS